MKNHLPRKRFGQHFLTDHSVIQKIVSAIDPLPDDNMIEIGPGLGALTLALLPMIKQLIALELDRDLISKLKKSCSSIGKLELYQGDALTFDFTTLAQKEKLRVVGNLPYNISTPLIFHLLQQISAIKDMHFMLQKEVVDRLAAKVGTKAYGRLSIMIQYHCEVEALFVVNKHAFDPPPEVESAVVRLIPLARPKLIANNPRLFSEVVKEAFNARRKTLRNALKNMMTDTQWKNLAIDPQLRPEQLTVEDFVRISNSKT